MVFVGFNIHPIRAFTKKAMITIILYMNTFFFTFKNTPHIHEF